MHWEPCTNTSEDMLFFLPMPVKAPISLRLSSRDRLTRQASSKLKKWIWPSLWVVSWVDAWIGSSLKYSETMYSIPRSCRMTPSMFVWIKRLSRLINARISFSTITILRVRKTLQLCLWATLTTPGKSSMERLVARFLALKRSRPRYMASAPARIAALMESISPPGASNSILFSISPEF